MAELDRKSAEEAKKRAEKQKEEQDRLNAQAQEEVKELQDAYPELKVSELKSDPLWVEAFKKDGGRLTLKEIYEYKYLPKVNSKNKDKNNDDDDDSNSKKLTKTPSSQANGKATPKSYLEMSDEEYLASETENSEDFF